MAGQVMAILAEAKRLAQEYRALTGKPLGITGEVAAASSDIANGAKVARNRTRVSSSPSGRATAESTIHDIGLQRFRAEGGVHAFDSHERRTHGRCRRQHRRLTQRRRARFLRPDVHAHLRVRRLHDPVGKLVVRLNRRRAKRAGYGKQ